MFPVSFSRIAFLQKLAERTLDILQRVLQKHGLDLLGDAGLATLDQAAVGQAPAALADASTSTSGDSEDDMDHYVDALDLD